ncbi:putative short-chain dehydrogenase/reductase family protein [Massarina eburnea CBS 473.64]|uniref:Putative short-chain dehydrogenase/reductase family protein n=1 Tax=Massarina eburnea CBS 473.64 TaxID=1395130 RepID=A0A6A6RR23_9PLEO|nr:putative short-chain dehydrogenase/reductase family protein [Massarina eburnea CBS 473.64]
MSKDLQPLRISAGKLFLQSQVCTKPQKPPASTDLTDQTAIVSGSNIGIGLQCCDELLKLGLSHLIMAVRSSDKGEKAAAPLRKAYPKARIDIWTLDMLSYDSIQLFVQRCETELKRLDVVILNAALILQEFTIHKPTGHEAMVQTNYLSTALLSLLLLPVLKEKRQSNTPGRLTIVSSGMALMAEMKKWYTEDLILPSFDNGTGWNLMAVTNRYSTTKTLLLMFISKLSDNMSASSVIVNAVDPGLTQGTGLHRNSHGPVKTIMTFAKMVTARSLQQGAWTYVDAAVVKGAESHGSFVMDWKICPFHDLMYTPEGKKATERLWAETLEELRFAHVSEVLKSVG